MATSDEPPPPSLTEGLSHGPWSPQSFDVVRRAPPFRGAPAANFLDLNAPFEEDPQHARGFSNLVDHLGSGQSEVAVSFMHSARGNDTEYVRPFMDPGGMLRNVDLDGASVQDTGPFVDYLSQFSGKKDVDFPEKERSKVEREANDLPDDLLCLSSSYHKKRGESGRPPTDGQTLFLAHGKVHDVLQQMELISKDQRAGASGGNFPVSRLNDVEGFREITNGHSGMFFEERSLFPRNEGGSDRIDSSYSTEEKVLLPRSAAQRGDPSKERMSLSLKRPFEEMDSACKEGEVDSDGSEAAQMKRRREAVASSIEQRFQNDSRRIQNDQVASDDRSVVWPPVVIIENTRLGWDEEKKKWKGLGHDDIRKSLKNIKDLEYAKVKCLFDVNGQKSSSLVIFPPTYEGYFEAEALHEQLERSGKGREQWLRVMPRELISRNMRGWYTPGDLVSVDGRRVLYGYIATPEDIKRVDPHKHTFKWFIESFNEKVWKPAQHMHQVPVQVGTENM